MTEKKLKNDRDMAENSQSLKKSWKFSNKEIAVRLFITCWLIFSLHFATNTVREIYPALSLGDKFSFDVSEYEGIHPDIFRYKDRGTFINNNPGASILGAIPYLLSRPVTDRIVEKVQKSRADNPPKEEINYESIYPMAQEFYKKAREKGFDIKFGLAAGVTQAFCMAVISAVSVVLMYFVLLNLVHNKRTSVLLALLYAFATPVFYRTAQLNQNILLAHFAFFAFVLLWRPWNSSEKKKKPFYFWAGICTGWTVVLDYSGLVAVLVLSGYAFARWLSDNQEDRRIQDLIRFGIGVTICALIMMAYQWSSFGNPILPAQSYMPNANFTELGYRGFSLPSPNLLFHTAFNIRFGLFTSAPLFLLFFIFPFWIRKKYRLFENKELLFLGAFIGLFFVFCSANQYGWMQFNSGVRHIVPVVPFLFLLTANVLIHIPGIFAALFAIVATYWSWCLVMYRDVEQGLGILEAIKSITLEGFQLPWLTTLERMGFIKDASVIPLFLLCGLIIWAIWRIDSNSSNTTLNK